MDWKQYDRHLVDCSAVKFETRDYPIEVKWDSTKGFHLLATRDIDVNGVILYEEPMIAAVSEETAGGWCRGCLAHTAVLYTNLKLCRECKLDKRLLCVLLTAGFLSPKNTLPNYLLSGRIHSERVVEKAVEPPSALFKPGKMRHQIRPFPFGDFTSGLRSKIPLPGGELEKILLLCDDVHCRDVQKEAVAPANLKTAPDVLRIECIVRNNVFKILDFDKVTPDTMRLEIIPEVGRGLYLIGSMVNHGCEGNGVIMMAERRLAIFARERIRKGEEITIAYGQRAPTTTRQQYHLVGTYGFICQCALCLACATCGERAGEGKKFPQCGPCGAVRYCSKECQKKDWSTHKSFCKEIPIMKRLGGKYTTDWSAIKVGQPVGNLDPEFYF